MRTPTRKNGERGFALLLVFLMAAAVALMLYQQVPRYAFESEREKEQLLQDRGKEYVRGVQLYYTAFKKYPAKIEDLENTNNKRFLRRRYIDPMTGKEEWRLIHVNAAGQLTDSVVQKPPASPTANGQDPNNPQSASGTSSTATGAGTGTATATGTATGAGTGTDAPPAVNATVARRPSDNTLTPPGGLAAPLDPNDPKNWPLPYLPAPGVNGPAGTAQTPGQQFPGQQQYPGQQNPGQPQFPGQFPTQQFPGQQFPGQQSGVPGFPGQLPFQPGANPFQPNQSVPGGNPFPTGINPNGNPTQGIGVQGGAPVQGGIMPTGGVYGFPPANGQNGTTGSVGTGSAAGSGSVSDALGAINNALRTPQQPQNGTTTAIGAGGLVGVASTYTAPSIKIYKDRQKYNEWEFIFDMKSLLPGTGGLPGLGQGAPGSNQPGQNGLPGQNGPGQNSNGSASPFFPGSGTGASPTTSPLGTSPTSTIHQ